MDELSDGIVNMSRHMTKQERLADGIRLYLLVGARILILPSAVLGFSLGGWVGCVIGAAVVWSAGIWIRRSLGIRGPGSDGWIQRIRERANGSRTGLLEYVIETIRGDGFTVDKSRAIIVAYDEAMAEMKLAATEAERKAILTRLDIETKRISYST